MDILLIVAASYLLYTVIVFVRNLFEFRSLTDRSNNNDEQPTVSICIPARNEEQVIKRCVTSALDQNYDNFEVLVLDDNSTDDTPVILSRLNRQYSSLKVIQGKPKPKDWLGKPWACQQLSEQSESELLIFIDADVWLESTAVSRSVNALKISDAITVWPKQEIKTFFFPLKTMVKCWLI